MVLACSAGPDSSALATIVAHLRPDLRLHLAYVAHGLRGEAQDRDEADRVSRLASRVGATHAVLPVAVARAGGGLESAARDARHAALEAEALALDAAAVLLGHHAEDQAETVLLRLARGTGPDGLAGMMPTHGMRVRPLLEVRRADLHRVADELAPGVIAGAADDPMNDEDAFARVSVRRHVLPALGDVGPDPVGAITRLAALVRDESSTLDALSERGADGLGIVTVGDAVALPSVALRALADAIARRVLRATLARAAGAPPDAETVERVLRAPDGWRATLAGPLDVEVGRGWHVIAPATARASDLPQVMLDLATPSVLHRPSGMTLAVERSEGATRLAARPGVGLPPGLAPGRLEVVLLTTGALGLRTRRDGDRVRTPGGTRSLSDLLSEAGVPRALRDLLPVIVDASGRVLWVPGVAVDADASMRPRGSVETPE